MNVKLPTYVENATYNGHNAECLCVKCMDADMNAFVASQGGTVYELEYTAPERMRFMAPGTRTGRGFVRHISDRQAKYIAFLIKTRDTSGIQIFPGQTLDITKVDTMGLPAARALIDKLLNAPEVAITSDETVRYATDRQRDYMRSLNDRIENPEWKISEADIKDIKFDEASEAIDCLKSVLNSERMIREANNTPAKPSTITPGIFRNNKGTFKVYKARGGSHMLAKKLNEDDQWEYAGAANRFVKASDRISLEEAKEYGKRTGNCMICSRELTKQESIDAGIGPICASKF